MIAEYFNSSFSIHDTISWMWDLQLPRWVWLILSLLLPAPIVAIVIERGKE